jgi:hypothetical protein
MDAVEPKTLMPAQQLLGHEGTLDDEVRTALVALRVPCTSKPARFANLTVVPLAMINVEPTGMVSMSATFTVPDQVVVP